MTDTKWEYLYLYSDAALQLRPNQCPGITEADLNYHGAEGWELVEARFTENGAILAALMKRKLGEKVHDT